MQQLAVDTLIKMEGVLDDPKPMALVNSLGDSNVTVRVYGWVNQREFSLSKVSSEAIKKTKQAFDDAGIVMPEPIYQIRLPDSSGLSGGQTTLASEPRASEKAEKISANAVKPRKETPTDLTPDETAIEQIQEESESGDNQNLLSPEARTE